MTASESNIAQPQASLSPERQAKLMRWATYASVSVAAILILAKLGGWLLTGSVAILASLLDSGLDILASLINLFAIRYALSPPDKEHRFGHGKAEPLASLGQSIAIAISAILLAYHAIGHLLEPQPLAETNTGLVIMLFSIVATAGLVSFQRYVIIHTGSTAIKADALHYLSDLFTQAMVVLAIFLSNSGFTGADPYIAVVIALYVFYSAWKIAKESLHYLMDHELSDAMREEIIKIVKAYPEVQGLHDLRTRQSGPNVFIQMHLELEDQMPLIRAHAISDGVEAALLAVYPNAHVIIHQDPVGLYRSEFCG